MLLTPIETDRLILRPLNSTFAPKILAFYKENKDVFDPYELTRADNFYTESYHIGAAEWEWQEMENGHAIRYYLFLKEDPRTIIGTVNFTDIKTGCLSKAALGYKIDHRYHRRGYAYEACCAALEVIFRDFKIHRVQTLISPTNIPSLGLIEKLGFSYEGIEYETAEVNGAWTDMHRYAILASQFLKSHH